MRNKRNLKNIVLEVLEERDTTLSKTLEEMIESLSKSIGKPICSDDAGQYIINDIDPHYARIKPITKDIFNLEYVKDRTDRYKFVYVSFDELKKKLKELIESTEKNYVDTAYNKCVENSKDNSADDRKSKIPDTDAKDTDVVGNIVKYYTKRKFDGANDMNDEKDNPDQPMYDMKTSERNSDIENKKVKYTFPKVPKEFKKFVVKPPRTSKMAKSV